MEFNKRKNINSNNSIENNRNYELELQYNIGSNKARNVVVNNNAITTRHYKARNKKKNLLLNTTNNNNNNNNNSNNNNTNNNEQEEQKDIIQQLIEDEDINPAELIFEQDNNITLNINQQSERKYQNEMFSFKKYTFQLSHALIRIVYLNGNIKFFENIKSNELLQSDNLNPVSQISILFTKNEFINIHTLKGKLITIFPEELLGQGYVTAENKIDYLLPINSYRVEFIINITRLPNFPISLFCQLESLYNKSIYEFNLFVEKKVEIVKEIKAIVNIQANIIINYTDNTTEYLNNVIASEKEISPLVYLYKQPLSLQYIFNKQTSNLYLDDIKNNLSKTATKNPKITLVLSDTYPILLLSKVQNNDIIVNVNNLKSIDNDPQSNIYIGILFDYGANIIIPYYIHFKRIGF